MRSVSVSIQMKAIEQYFLGYGNMLYRGILPLESWMESQSYMTIQTKATELYFLVVRHFAVQGGSKFWVYTVES